jgi:hypothetical protein
MAEEQRILTPDETAAIKTKLSNVLQNTSEDASDLLEYTLAMIVNGKTVDYIVDELKSMEMDICGPEACDTIGNEILRFLNESDKKKTSMEKNKIQFNKSSVENALTKSGALGTKKPSNALTMSGALGASRQTDGKKDQSIDKQRGPDDRNLSDRARDRQGRGNRGGRSIASEAFNRLSGQRQRDDKRGGQSGRGGGRDGGQFGRGGRGERGGRGRDWSQPVQPNKRGRDENNHHAGSGRGKDTNIPNKKTKGNEVSMNQDREHKKQDGQENLEYQEYGEEYYEGYGGYDYNAWNGWDDGSGFYNYPYGYAGYDPSYWNAGYPIRGGHGRGRGRGGRGGRGRGRGGDAQQVDATGQANGESEVVTGESNDAVGNEGGPTAQTTADESTIAAAAVSASPLVGAHFSRYSYSSSGRTPGRGRGGRGRGRGGRALVAERLAAMSWSRSKATENSNATNETSEAAPEQSS